jgi:hypothetical protein
MESFNFGAFDTQLPGRIAAIPQEAQKQQTANMLQAMQMQGAMNQNELARYSLASAQRSDASQNAVNDALKRSIVNGKLDYDALTTNLAGGAGAAKIPDFLKARSEEEKRTQDILKTKGDIEKQTRDAVDAELISFAKNAPRVTDVPKLTNHLKAFFGHPLLGKMASKFKTYEQALADDIQQISTPEGLSQWQAENSNLTGKEFIDLYRKVTTRTIPLGNVSRAIPENAMGQQIGPVVDTLMGMTPGQVRTSEDAARSRAQSERQFLTGQGKPVFSNESQGFVYPPTKENPQGRFVPVTGMGDKPLNESQANAALYGSAMVQANGVIKDIQNKGTIKPAIVPGLIQGIVSLAPLGIGEAASNAVESIFRTDPTGLIGPDVNQQKLAQAQLAFAIAILRKTSGAAFGAQEVANTIKEYFPLQGEGPDVVDQKSASRLRAIEGMSLSAGKSGADFIKRSAPPVKTISNSQINDAIAESIKVGNPKTRDQVIKAAKEKGYEILSGASK